MGTYLHVHQGFSPLLVVSGGVKTLELAQALHAE